MRKASKNGQKNRMGGEDPGGTRIDLGYEKPGGTKNETKHGIAFPVNVYPLFETAIRGRMEIQWKNIKVILVNYFLLLPR